MHPSAVIEDRVLTHETHRHIFKGTLYGGTG